MVDEMDTADARAKEKAAKPPEPPKLSVWSIQYVASGKRFHSGKSINVVAQEMEQAITKFRLAHPDGENSKITSVNKGPIIHMGINEVDNCEA